MQFYSETVDDTIIGGLMTIQDDAEKYGITVDSYLEDCLCQCFSVADECDAMKETGLKPDGENEQVTEETLPEFMWLALYHFVLGRELKGNRIPTWTHPNSHKDPLYSRSILIFYLFPAARGYIAFMNGFWEVMQDIHEARGLGVMGIHDGLVVMDHNTQFSHLHPEVLSMRRVSTTVLPKSPQQHQKYIISNPNSTRNF